IASGIARTTSPMAPSSTMRMRAGPGDRVKSSGGLTDILHARTELCTVRPVNLLQAIEGRRRQQSPPWIELGGRTAQAPQTATAPRQPNRAHKKPCTIEVYESEPRTVRARDP